MFLSILNHMMTSNPFKLTCMIWLPGVSHLIYLSILLRVSTYHDHLIKQFPHHTYNIRGNPINTTHSHKDLGVIVSDNLNWNIYITMLFLVRHIYRALGLVRGSFSSTIPTPAKVKLYTSLIRSQVLYCSPVWRPYLIKDINKLE